MVLLVTYDLHGPRRNYAAVKRLLDSVPNVHPEGSVWFIDSNATPDAWVNALLQTGDGNDEFFVARIYQNWQSARQDSSATAWLNDPRRTW